MSQAPDKDDMQDGEAASGGGSDAPTVTGRGENRVRLTAWVRGRVQGVGFRWWTRSTALEIGLVGSAANLDDGRVEVIAEGSRSDCERLLEALRGPGTPGSVSGVTERWSDPRGDLTQFVER